MATILDDKNHKHMHLQALFLNGIIILGEDVEEAVLSRLLERKEMRFKANDSHGCKQGQHWSDSLNKCVDDIG